MTVPSPLRSAIWLKIAIGLLILSLTAAWLALAGSRANAASTDLFFSEYVEGTSTNKALELYNGTAGAISLDGVYTVQIFANGSVSATATIPLLGSIGASESFVLARAGAHADLLTRADQTTSNFLFRNLVKM